MSQFAKLFEIEGVGQVLYVLQDGDDGPEIKFRTANEFGLEACMTFSGYGDDDAGWHKAESVFGSIDQAKAVRDSESMRATLQRAISGEA